MKRVKITQGQYAIVDPEDYEKIKDVKWYAMKNQTTGNFYAARTEYKKVGSKVLQSVILLSRLVMGIAKGDRRQVRHLKGTLDCRKENLKIV
jgi:hypothetical protein